MFEEELAEQKEFRNYVMHNHPNVTENFEMVQDVKRYQNELEALAQDFKAAFDAAVEEYNIDDEALVGDIEETHDFF